MIQADLQKRVGVVTGAGRGIGKAIALALSQCGAHVVLIARTAAQLEEVAATIRRAGGSATPIAADISHEQGVVDAFERVKESLGRLDVLVNNAGIGLFGPLAEFTASDFDRVMGVNVRGVFMCCRQAMRLMIPRKSGYIINISSVVGFKGYPNQAAYTASKHAVMGLTKSLAAEAQGYGIRVSAILPGGVDTGLVGSARPDLKPGELMQAEDVAEAVLYLLSLSDRVAVDQICLRRRNSSPF